MKKWEYAMVTALVALPKNEEHEAEDAEFTVTKGTIPLQTIKSKGELPKILASLGGEGWEAVGLTTVGVALIILLKRPL
jgi:hypothetical protein